MYEVGKTLAKMHYMSLDYKSNKKNDYSYGYIKSNMLVQWDIEDDSASCTKCLPLIQSPYYPGADI